MLVGLVVNVATKHFGTLTGVVVEENPFNQPNTWLVKPYNHPRNVVAEVTNIEVVV